MVEKLLNLHQNSYTPTYKFPVSAIVVAKDGREFVGVNVENANGTSICAERVAITSAIAHGLKKGDFKEINIMVSNGRIGTPCFACRQVMLEFFNDDDIVRCYSANGEFKEYTIKELCPYPFGVEDLK